MTKNVRLYLSTVLLWKRANIELRTTFLNTKHTKHPTLKCHNHQAPCIWINFIINLWSITPHFLEFQQLIWSSLNRGSCITSNLSRENNTLYRNQPSASICISTLHNQLKNISDEFIRNLLNLKVNWNYSFIHAQMLYEKTKFSHGRRVFGKCLYRSQANTFNWICLS